MMGRRGKREPRRLGLLVVLATLVAIAGIDMFVRPATARPNLLRQATRPIVLDPDLGLFGQFGYAPAYTRSVPTFDALNRPYIRSRSADPDYTAYVHTLRDGRWVRLDLIRWVRLAYPDFDTTEAGGGGPDNRIAFDRSDRAYTLLTVRLESGAARNLMLWSEDYGATWRVVTLPAGGNISCETGVGHNSFDGPPLLLIVRREANLDPYTGLRRRSLSVTLPYFEDGDVVVPKPTLVSTHCLLNDGVGNDTSVAVTHGGATELVWSQTTARKKRGGPTLVATFDRANGVVGPAVVVARTLPANDGHARPAICLDSKGYLHVLTGAHGTPFRYVRSVVPGTPYAGWTKPKPVLDTGWLSRDGATESGRQTYLSFVCDATDALHIAFRQWRRGVDSLFRGAKYGALSYQCRPSGGVWSDAQVLVAPPYPGYTLYFQQLAVDRLGHLYLSAACIAGPEVQERRVALARRRLRGGSGPLPPLYLRRMILVPTGPGDRWRFATTEDFASRVIER